MGYITAAQKSCNGYTRKGYKLKDGSRSYGEHAQTIYQLHKQDKMSFGMIAIKLGKSRQAICRSYQSYVKHHHEDIDS